MSRLEKPALEWLAERLPAGVKPDHLTVFGALGALAAGLALALAHYHPALLLVALAGLAVNWLGDSLDGTLARWRRIERPRYGFFVDHMTDAAAQVCVLVGLGLSPLMRLDVALLALAAYLAMTVYTLVRVHLFQVMQITYFGFGPTEARVALGAGLLATLAIGGSPVVPTVLGRFSLFDLGVLGLAAMAAAALVVLFVRDRASLALEDPEPRGLVRPVVRPAAGERVPSAAIPAGAWPRLVPVAPARPET